MERYPYERIEVIGEQQTVFDASDARALALAIEYLATTAPGKLAWLSVSMTITLGRLCTPVSSLLTYDQIRDKTEPEIWRMLDANTEKHIEMLKKSRRSFADFDH